MTSRVSSRSVRDAPSAGKQWEEWRGSLDVRTLEYLSVHTIYGHCFSVLVSDAEALTETRGMFT